MQSQNELQTKLNIAMEQLEFISKLHTPGCYCSDMARDTINMLSTGYTTISTTNSQDIHRVLCPNTLSGKKSTFHRRKAGK